MYVADLIVAAISLLWTFTMIGNRDTQMTLFMIREYTSTTYAMHGAHVLTGMRLAMLRRAVSCGRIWAGSSSSLGTSGSS